MSKKWLPLTPWTDRRYGRLSVSDTKGAHVSIKDELGGLNPTQRRVVDRALEYMNDEPTEPLLDDERQSMRAFLQRAETRLSTYQRVAGVFLNGAGLLILLPTTARDSVQSVVYFAMSTRGLNPETLLLIPWAIALGVPLYAFLLLLRDLVEFYFAPKFLSNDNIQVTRFSLAGLSFPYDESVEAKGRILAYGLAHPQYVRFVLGDAGSPARRSAAAIYRESKSGNIAYPIRLALSRELNLAKNDQSTEPTDVEYGMVAASVAGSLDITLTEEVTRIEASIERHVLGLRRLVLRYMKALVLFVWTTVATLLVVAAISAEAYTKDERLLASIAVYLVWSTTSILVIRLPRRWIDALAKSDRWANGERTKVAQDEDIRKFERRVTWVLGGTSIFLLAQLILTWRALGG